MFTRKSTGLVRQGRWIDSFVFNSSSSWLFGPLVFALSSLTWLNGYDLVSAEIIALVFCLGIAAMYAITTSLMPRSGGDYVFNSRVLHPSIGFAFNFSLWFWQLFSAAFTLYFVSNYALSPGLVVLGFYSGNTFLTNAGNALGQPFNSFILASALNIIFTLVVASGIKRTFRILDVLWAVTLVGTAGMIISLTLSNMSSFERSFNSYVSAVNGTSSVVNPYNFVIQQGGASQLSSALAIPAVAICASSVIWVFWETYLAGEVRRSGIARRNFTTMGGAAILNGVLFIVFVYLLYKTVGVNFIVGIANLSFLGVIFSSPLQALTATIILASGNFPMALLIVVSMTLGTTILLLPALYLQPVRSLFAWSTDGIVPSKIGNVSDRFHTPLVSTLLVFIVVEAALAVITWQYQSLLAVFYAVIIAPVFSSVLPTSVAAIVLGLGARTKWFRSGASNPKSTSRILGMLGFASFCFVLFMTYVFLTNEANFSLTPILVITNLIFVPVGFLLYVLAHSYRKAKNNVNLNEIALEIPPE